MNLSAFFAALSCWPVLLTVGAYLLCAWIQKKTGWGFLSPIILAAAAVYVILRLIDLPLEEYTRGTSFLSYLLTPATICLGLSLYEQLQKLKKELPVLLAGIAAGTVCSPRMSPRMKGSYFPWNIRLWMVKMVLIFV